MHKKYVGIVALVIIILGIGYLVLNRDTRDNATFSESIRMIFDKDYETRALRADRAQVKETHAANLRLLWKKDFVTLQKNYANPYILLGDDEPIDFIAEVKTQADNPIFTKNVEILFDFNSNQVFTYKEMITLGFDKEIGTAVIREGDFLANIQPNPNSPDNNNIESHIVLYRKINGAWIAIGGFR